jgi:membrane protease YdiL (CAAX protease family)
MRPARALWAYLIFIFIGAALIAPWVSYALPALGLSGIPFRRVVDRCLLVLALLGLWPFVKALGVRSTEELGLRKYSGAGADLAKGLCIGTVLLGLAAGASLGAGASQFDTERTSGAWLKQIPSAFFTAVIVAFLEEVLFRGAIFGALRRAWNDRAALWSSSAIYAILHFFARPENPSVLTWNSGFIVLGRMLGGFTELPTVIPGFFSLTLLGVIFALAFQRTGALYLSMGIHAALIFWIKLFGFGANPVATANLWFWGTGKLIDGWFCFVLLVFTALWLARRPARA